MWRHNRGQSLKIWLHQWLVLPVGSTKFWIMDLELTLREWNVWNCYFGIDKFIDNYKIYAIIIWMGVKSRSLFPLYVSVSLLSPVYYTTVVLSISSTYVKNHIRQSYSFCYDHQTSFRKLKEKKENILFIHILTSVLLSCFLVF